MDVKKCPICGHEQYRTIHKGIRGKIKIQDYDPRVKKDVDVLKCNNCGHVWLKTFINNADGFFEESGMRDFDPPSLCEVRKDMAEEHDRYYRDTLNLISNKTLCDFGCGSGGYLDRAKAITKEYVGIEMERAMRIALVKEWGEGHCFKSIDEVGKFDVITMFHVLDHLQSPYEYFEELKKHLNEGGKIYIETPNADDALISLYDCQAFSDFTYYICHFMYYTASSIRILAEKAGFTVDYIKYRQRYPVANHLYWLKNGLPGGHEKWAFLRNNELDDAYGNTLAMCGATDTITALIGIE